MNANGRGPVVLLVEDSDTLLQYGLVALSAGGYEVEVARDGRQALTRYRDSRPDAVVLDVDLPVLSGWEVLERIRANDTQTPVLMLTATAPDERSRVRGLIGGADDYLVKPVGPAELRARVAALLRRGARSVNSAPANGQDDVYSDPVLTVDFARRRAIIAGRELPLTPLEFKLLATLVRHAGETLGRTPLLEQVWEDYSGVGGDQVKVYIGYLRRKLEDATDVQLIETVRGFGYRYRVPESETAPA